MSVQVDKPKAGYSLLKGQTNYWRFFAANVVSRFGDSVDAIAYAWLVYHLTDSASMSAITVGINALPSVLFTPLAAPLIERMNKKTVMIAADLGRAAIVSVIAVVYLLGLLAPWMLLVGTFLTSTLEAFRQPAGMAAYPRIVPRECYTPAQSLSSSASQVAQLIGTALAAVIIGVLGAAGALWIDGMTFVFSAGMIALIRLRVEPGDESAPQPLSLQVYWGDLKSGLTYLGKKPLILFICAFAAVLNMLLIPFSALGPAFSELLQRGPVVLSLMNTSVMAGMLVGSALYPYAEARIPRWKLFVGATFALAVGHIGWASVLYLNAPWARFALLAASFGIVGIGAGVMSMVANISFMQHVEEAYLARTSSVMTAGCMAMMPVGAFGIAALTATISVPTFLLIFAACVVVMAVGLPFIRVIREL